ncbi:DUF4167 domain-containing protein [Rhodobacteraceae bacterium NNCM2]|nr:DUF4167 domain-containing protein [Coraliihabitans acroporae]
MRSPQKNNRARGRGRTKGNGNSANRVYESTGPEGKVRGTPQQIIEKYLSLARDAQTSGDRVVAENFLQHAEHYQRILIQATATQQTQDQRRDDQGEQNKNQNEIEAEKTTAKEDQPQPEMGAVDGLTTIDSGKPEAENLIVGEDEMATSQPTKSRKPRRAVEPSDDAPEMADTQSEA